MRARSPSTFTLTRTLRSSSDAPPPRSTLAKRVTFALRRQVCGAFGVFSFGAPSEPLASSVRSPLATSVALWARPSARIGAGAAES